jgi:subtilase family serine protease
MITRRRSLFRSGIALAISAVTAVGLIAAGPPASATAGPVTHRIKVHPQIWPAVRGSAVHFSCQDRPINGSAGPKCYQPAQIQAAYGLTPLLNTGKTGAGRTIVIVDAFQSPYIQSDLSIFNSTFGLPNASFQQIAPFGLTPFDPNDPNMVGWAKEITLDVLWAHAMAPRAKILLALARSNDDADILNTTKYVVDHDLGDVISQSFGEAETCKDPALLAQEHQVFADATSKGITLFASSGDSGAAQFNCSGTGAILAASTPASDPLVTGVGGTTLNADGTTGAYIGETAWTEPLVGCNPPAVKKQDINCSGGGFSTLYSRPSFQSSIGGSGGRGVPDVAYDAGVNGGVLTHCGICNLVAGFDPTDPTIFFLFGGTSAGTPQWAGLTAVGDQIAGRRLGDLNTALYTVGSSANYASALHDETIGNNFVQEIHTGYTTAPNWDPVTGLGSPNAAALLPLLISLTS